MGTVANVVLYIDDMTHALTLRALLEAGGHRVVPEPAQVVVTDQTARAVREASERPTLLVSGASDLPAAVKAMQAGVFGYIFVPFVPGEAALMVERALAAHQTAPDVTTSGPPVADDGWPTLDDVEMQHILTTLRRCKNNHSKTARVLGIGRNTLWRKLKRLRSEAQHLPREGEPQPEGELS